MKIKNSVIISILFFLLLTGCTNSEENNNEIKLTTSAKELKKENFFDVETRLKKEGFENIELKEDPDLVTGWITKEGDVEKVSINGVTDFETGDVFDKDAKVVIIYHVFPEESSEESSIMTDSTNTETTDDTESIEETITVKNNEEFAHIINDTTDDYDVYKKFAEKYENKKIEFDANIANMMFHEDKKTRYDFLIYGGDYSNQVSSGAPFQIRDGNVGGLNLKGDNIPDTIGEGINIHLIAEVIEYDDNADLLLIKPIETRIR